MNAGPVIQLDALVLPGHGAADGERVAAALQRELGRLWARDRDAGVGWREAIGAITLELDPALPADRMGAAIAAAVRGRAVGEDAA